MRSTIISLFGSYVPTVYTDADGIDIIPSGMAGLDYEWLAGVLLFALTMYCVFRIVGGLLNVHRR